MQRCTLHSMRIIGLQCQGGRLLQILKLSIAHCGEAHGACSVLPEVRSFSSLKACMLAPQYFCGHGS